MHFAFLDLEKAFDRIPRGAIWYALQRHSVPEKLIEGALLVPKKQGEDQRAPRGGSNLCWSAPKVSALPIAIRRHAIS